MTRLADTHKTCYTKICLKVVVIATLAYEAAEVETDISKMSSMGRSLCGHDVSTDPFVPVRFSFGMRLTLESDTTVFENCILMPSYAMAWTKAFTLSFQHDMAHTI